MRLLIIEDDKEIRELIKLSIEELKYEVMEEEDGRAGIKTAGSSKPQLIILDVGLPDMSGWDICKEIRSNPEKYENPVIIMLTAASDQQDVLKGFEIGADEYITKPFNEQELFYRITRFSSRFVKDGDMISYSDIRMFKNNLSVFLDDSPVKLGKKEFELLEFLIINKGILLRRENILNKIWEDDWDVGDRAVDQCIKRLRSKFPTLKENLKTKRGFGYILKSV